MNISYYFDNLRRRWAVRQFNKAAAGVMDTPPQVLGKDGPMLLSMVHHRDVLPYLLALKSFAQHLLPSRVVVVADKTIDASDEAMFRQQVPEIELRRAHEFERPGVPVGGTWERLMAIAHYVSEAYVIQLDADTMTLADIDHVVDCFKKNVSFTIGTYDLQAKVSVTEVSRWAQSHCKTYASPHIQLVCEAALLTAAAAGDPGKFYIRGCSGFAGFGRGSFSPDDLVALSKRMQQQVGDAWAKWGTEQFASNFVVANIPGSEVLPHPVYTTPNKIDHTTAFVHFIGPHRYLKGIYLKEANRFLGRIRSAVA